MERELHWFHAFNRDSAGSLAEVLTQGAAPNPSPNSGTARNELHLDIRPPRVYAYLGRTIEEFGQRAIVVARDAVQDGDLSPFDTGGLVQHISPICTWDKPTKRGFLGAYTWTYDQLDVVLSLYPAEYGQPYLAGARPTEHGPSSIFQRGYEEATCWSDASNTWRAWTWELRSSNKIPAGTTLVAWSCHPDEYAELQEALEQVAETDEELLEHLLSSYCDGGVSVLVAALQSSQAVA
jgi:hypothetical protein